MSNKVALVTGASSGIGEATATQLKDAGFVVYGAARRTERMEGLSARGIKVLKMDVTDDASMVAGIEQILAEVGRIDVLVNNAGYGSYGAVEDVDIAEAKRQFDVNVFGLARLTQLVLPSMRANKSGKIINISSVAGRFWEPFGAWYHATKFAVEGFSDCLRLEVKPFGIDVILIEPAAIRTEWNGIARNKLFEVSGSGPYGARASSHAEWLGNVEISEGTSVGPEVVAAKIVKSATARWPRTRYPVGKGAQTITLASRLLPTRVFDFFLTTVMR